MGFFNRNNDDEYLLILGEIRDNLRLNNDDVLKELENRISEAKHENLEEVGVLASKVKTLEKISKLQSTQIDESYKIIDKLESKVNELVGVVEKYTEIIKILTKETETEAYKKEINSKPKIEKKGKNVIRTYGKNWNACGYVKINSIDCLTDDGKFKRSKRTKGIPYFSWDINTLLKLKTIMKDFKKYNTFRKIGDKIGFSGTMVKELGYYILNGDFDQYFKEWEQIQADKIYKKGWKQQIQNNPEKRKELGIYG